MNFQIHYKDRDYNYNLGNSNPAVSACHHLSQYKKTSQYDDLKSILANLYWIVNEDPNLKKNACLATRIFALQVFPTLNSNYEKLFVANSVTSIYCQAHYDPPKDWMHAQADYAQRITAEGVNAEKAEMAGFASFNLKQEI